jgi:hypothetical protein
MYISAAAVYFRLAKGDSCWLACPASSGGAAASSLAELLQPHPSMPPRQAHAAM